jgi:hypothetical protein
VSGIAGKAQTSHCGNDRDFIDEAIQMETVIGIQTDRET